jgi:hypothetical protein
VRDFVDLEALTGEHVLGACPRRRRQAPRAAPAYHRCRAPACRAPHTAPRCSPSWVPTPAPRCRARQRGPALTSLGSSVLLATSDRAAASQAPGSVACRFPRPEHLLGAPGRLADVGVGPRQRRRVPTRPTSRTRAARSSSPVPPRVSVGGRGPRLAPGRRRLVEDLRRPALILGLVVVEEASAHDRSLDHDVCPAPGCRCRRCLQRPHDATTARPPLPSSKNGGSAPAGAGLRRRLGVRRRARGQAPGRAWLVHDRQRSLTCASVRVLQRGHSLLALQEWWSKEERRWNAFDTADARAALGTEKRRGALPTTRNLPNLAQPAGPSAARRLKPDVIMSTGAGIALPFRARSPRQDPHRHLGSTTGSTRDAHRETGDAVDRPARAVGQPAEHAPEAPS